MHPRRLICSFGFAPQVGHDLACVLIGVPHLAHFIVPMFVSCYLFDMNSKKHM